MGTPPQANPPDPSKYYESRAKEFRERYESMRTLEWQTLLQTYAGYGAIAVAFQKVSADTRLQSHQSLVSTVAMAATLIFATAMHYLYFRIEERLITFEANANYWFKKMGEPTPHDDGAPGTEDLGHRFFWTYDMQMIVSTLAVLLILAYEGYSASPRIWTCITIALLLGAILSWLFGRKSLKRLLEKRDRSAKGQ